jgi:hypothetical protein
MATENQSNEQIVKKENDQNPKTSPPVKNTLVWILACLPIIGAFFEFGTIVFLIITIILCSVDAKNLRKLGYEDKSIGGSWLVPVYLYNRAKYFNHNKGYFVMWCITFFLSLFGFWEGFWEGFLS